VYRVLYATELMNFSKAFPRTTTDGAMAFDAHLKMEEPGPVEYLPVAGPGGCCPPRRRHAFGALVS